MVCRSTDLPSPLEQAISQVTADCLPLPLKRSIIKWVLSGRDPAMFLAFVKRFNAKAGHAHPTLTYLGCEEYLAQVVGLLDRRDCE